MLCMITYCMCVWLFFTIIGTVEWLPGSPLGNTYETWPDLLMGSMPNIYVYAANNPSESILAKRRGYGTIVSHNVSCDVPIAIIMFAHLQISVMHVYCLC
jgi:CobN/Magnesium Chelatase